jgi:hypothetical protein
MIDQQLLKHIVDVAKIPSFSSYEDRLHPYIRSVASATAAEEFQVPGYNLVYRIGHDPADRQDPDRSAIAITAHIDKNNHYGENWTQPLQVAQLEDELEGAMDDSVGVGIALRLMEWASKYEQFPTLYFYFSEMEESLGLKKHPEWMRNGGSGLKHGMGARRIAQAMIESQAIPNQVITLDTTPLFKGDPGIALYDKHWEYNELEPSNDLVEATQQTVNQFKALYPDILISNNTNDYLQYGYEFNQQTAKPVVSIALEPSIYPYHQKGERVYYTDIQRTFELMVDYLSRY